MKYKKLHLQFGRYFGTNFETLFISPHSFTPVWNISQYEIQKKKKDNAKEKKKRISLFHFFVQNLKLFLSYIASTLRKPNIFDIK